MALPVTDTFTSGTTQSIDAYGPYVVLEGALNVISGDPGVAVTGGSYNTAYRSDETPNADQYAQTVITADQIAGSFYAGPAVRCQTDNSSYHVDCNGSEFYISKNLAGSQSTLAGPVSQSFAAGDIIRLEVTGTGGTVTLKVFKALAASPTSFSQVGSDYTDSSSPITAAGYLGVFGYGNTSTNVVIGTFVGGNLGSTFEITSVDGDNDVYDGQGAVPVVGSGMGADETERVFTLRQGSNAATQTEIGSGTDVLATLNITSVGSGVDMKYGAATMRVTLNSDSSYAEKAVTVNPPPGQSYVDLGTPNSIANDRLTSSADLASGDQIHYRGENGAATPAGLTVANDATFSFAAGYPPTSFEFRVWSVADSTWGAWALQTITPVNATRVALSRRRRRGGETMDLSAAEWATEGLIVQKWFDWDMQAPSSAATITGSGAITFDPLTASGAGVVTRKGSGAITFDPLEVAGSGVRTSKGSGAILLPTLEVAGTGLVGKVGSGDITFDPLEVDGAGAVERKGSGSITFEALQVAGTGVRQAKGSGDIQLPELQVAGGGTVQRKGSGDIAFDPLEVDGTGTTFSGVGGSGAIVFPTMQVAGSGVVTRKGSGDIAFEPLEVAGTGTVEAPTEGSGAILFDPLEVSGAGTRGVVGSGAITFPALRVSGYDFPPVADIYDYLGGTAVDRYGRMVTSFIEPDELLVVPHFIEGFAHDESGRRFVTTWPAEVGYLGGLAVRYDGVQVIAPDTAPDRAVCGIPLTYRGETCVSENYPAQSIEGFGLDAQGLLTITDAGP